MVALTKIAVAIDTYFIHITACTLTVYHSYGCILSLAFSLFLSPAIRSLLPSYQFPAIRTHTSIRNAYICIQCKAHYMYHTHSLSTLRGLYVRLRPHHRGCKMCMCACVQLWTACGSLPNFLLTQNVKRLASVLCFTVFSRWITVRQNGAVGRILECIDSGINCKCIVLLKLLNIGWAFNFLFFISLLVRHSALFLFLVHTRTNTLKRNQMAVEWMKHNQMLTDNIAGTYTTTYRIIRVSISPTASSILLATLQFINGLMKRTYTTYVPILYSSTHVPKQKCSSSSTLLVGRASTVSSSSLSTQVLLHVADKWV